jgi:prepilin-type processing-associated H-X9-DG protein
MSAVIGCRDSNVPYVIVQRPEYQRVAGAWFAGRDLQSSVDFMDRHPRLIKIEDGLSHTAMIYEQAGLPFTFDQATSGGGRERISVESWVASDASWTLASSSEAVVYLQHGQGINSTNLLEIFAFHPHGANISRCDGSVHFTDAGTDQDILFGLLGRANGPR